MELVAYSNLEHVVLAYHLVIIVFVKPPTNPTFELNEAKRLPQRALRSVAGVVVFYLYMCSSCMCYFTMTFSVFLLPSAMVFTTMFRPRCRALTCTPSAA